MHRLAIALPLLATVVVAGCAPARVQLPAAPTKETSLELRRAYYEEHRPMAVRGTTPAHAQGAGSYLILEDGTRVESAAELLQVVESTSPTARAAARAADEERTTLAWSLAAGGMYGGGLVLMLSSFATLPFVGQGPDGVVSDQALVAPVGLVLAGGAVSLAGIVPMLLAFESGGRATLEKDTAFLTYDRSLRERLNLSRAEVSHLRPVAVQNKDGAFELEPREGDWRP